MPFQDLNEFNFFSTQCFKCELFEALKGRNI